MRKRTILWLVLASILLWIIGAAIFVPGVVAASSQCTQEQINNGTCAINSPGAGAAVVIGILMWAIAAVLGLVAWIGALIRSASMHSWGWFIILLLFSGLGTLIYAFVGPPDQPKAPAYYPPNYPSGYPPPYPANYPPPPYPANYPPPTYPPDQRPPATG